MNPNPYLIERLAQLKVAEVQRAARYAWLRPPRRPPALWAAFLAVPLTAAAALLWLLL